MTIVCPVSQIVDKNFQSTGNSRLGYDSVLERALKKVRKNRDNMEPHLYAPPASQLQQAFRYFNRYSTGFQVNMTANCLHKRYQYVASVYSHFQ